VRFSPLHPRATPLQESFGALFHGRARVGILREKLAAARTILSPLHLSSEVYGAALLAPRWFLLAQS